MDRSEQMPASLVHGNFTRGRTTLGQSLWDLGDWGALVIEQLSVLFESASLADVLETSFTGSLYSLSDSSFSLAARPCRRVGEVNGDGCGSSVVIVLPSVLAHAFFDSMGFTCSLAFERS